MPKRKSTLDVSQNAVRIVEQAIGEPLAPRRPSRSLISRVMSEMGKKGGKKGGKRRLETMTPEERSRVALKAAQARWARRKSE